MYKLLNPTHIGTSYMVEQLKEHIAHIGHEKIQSLKGETVCIEGELTGSMTVWITILAIDPVRGNSSGTTYEVYEYHQRYIFQ
jgi:hypothetical protein